MGHLALYRQWRPRTFDEVVEQTYTVAALKQSVITGSIAHAYLFSGTRGTGKTTMALLYSKAINCLAPENGNPCNRCEICLGIQNGTVLDVIEMDAASNNSVDTIRRICDEVMFSPSVARYKVYIIDEVHMLSAGAFNALLKTLEEPPAHAVFLLATTEPHRIPATILSRCQRYEFRRIPVPSIVARLREIADADSIAITEDALRVIAQLSDGALRDAISLLDQASVSYTGSIGKEDILALVGVVNDSFMHQMVQAIAASEAGEVLDLVDKLILDGRDVVRFTSDLAFYFRNLMICRLVNEPSALIYVPDQTIREMQSAAGLFTLESIFEVIRDLSALIQDLKWSPNPRIIFEIALIRMMQTSKPHTRPDPASEPKSTSIPKPEPKPAPEKSAPEKSAPEKSAPEKSSPEKPVKSEPRAEALPPQGVDFEDPLPPPEPFTGIKELWPKILEGIVATGNMTLYLFLVPGVPRLEGDRLSVIFEDKDRLNHKEVSESKNLDILANTARSFLGFRPVVRALLSPVPDAAVGTGPGAEKAPTSDPSGTGSANRGIEALKSTAENLGIAFYIEE